MILLYLCVIVCNIFESIPSNGTQIVSIEVDNNKDLKFISPFIWLQNICNYCFKRWEIAYVQNASLYTTFLLFTGTSGPNYTIVDIGNKKSLSDGGFNSSIPTKVLIHGWLDNGTNSFAEELRRAYQSDEDVNIIAVDWSPMSEQLFYMLSRSAVTPVGTYTAQFVDFLVINVGISPDSLNLLGHSLGAHVSGVVGQQVTFGNVTRITGLDPAGPLFDETEPQGRLDSSDANFVDVIHTTWGYLSYAASCGDADFYPNKGDPIQPGCGIDLGFCSHRRAYYYFSESISSLGFISTNCSNWDDYVDGLCANNSKTVMGQHVDLSAKGDYYLKTNPSSPYAAWNNSLT